MRESLRFVMELEVSLLLFRIDIVCFFVKIVIICEEFYKLKYCSTVVYMVPRA